MSTAKKISLVVIVLAVIGSIWYLESMKVHPVASGSAQSIGFSTTSTAALASASSTASPASITAALRSLAAADQAAGYQPAKEIVDPTGFINASSSFQLANLVGKQVILLDFWTYSCINCLRTIPYLDAWYQKYANQGLTIVGIHTPEFDFEKNIANVQAAVTQYGIQYPVVLDSDYGTWTAYGNLYWPHEYLIDMAGYIVHDQVGEGNYAETEAEIQKLLEQRDAILGVSPAGISTSTAIVNAVTPSGGAISPETYFGAERNEYLANGNQSVTGTQILQAPASTAITADTLYLAGSWNFADQYATNNAAGAKVFYEYQAAKVYIVASATSSSMPVTVEVLQDDQPITAADAGSDVHNGVVTIGASRLYNLVSNQGGTGVHELELIIDQPGLQAYTFTFG